MLNAAAPRSVQLSSAGDLEQARRCAVDPSARDILYREHVHSVYRLALRLLGRPEDAEEVVQESFIAVFRAIGRFRGEAALSSWIHRIAVRTAMRYRKRGRRSAARLALVEAPTETQSFEDGEVLDRGRALARIYKLLAQLNDGRRAVFILHEVEGCTLPETAALLGISVTAAKKRVWRARQELEKLARGDELLVSFLDGDHSCGGEDG